MDQRESKPLQKIVEHALCHATRIERVNICPFRFDFFVIVSDVVFDYLTNLSRNKNTSIKYCMANIGKKPFRLHQQRFVSDLHVSIVPDCRHFPPPSQTCIWPYVSLLKTHFSLVLKNIAELRM
jgi:hypothetical protein